MSGSSPARLPDRLGCCCGGSVRSRPGISGRSRALKFGNIGAIGERPDDSREAIRSAVIRFKADAARGAMKGSGRCMAAIFLVASGVQPQPRTSLATRTSSAWPTLPCAWRSFDAWLNLPELDGAASAGCTCLPLSFFFLLFLLLVVMRLDGEEHDRS